MNSGHQKIEANRMGLHGPYVLAFTDGPAPSSNIDTSFIAKLGLKDYVADADRGSVTGQATGLPSAYYPTVVSFGNSHAQYWCQTDSKG